MATFELASKRATHSDVNSHWTQDYRRLLLATDTFVVIVSVVGTQLLWLGTEDVQLSGRGHLTTTYSVVSILLIAGWLAVLQLYNTRSARSIGYGPTEYRLIADGALRLFGVVAIVSYIGGYEVSRGLILLSFPIGLLGLIASRYAWRKWLWSQRRHGRFISHVLIVGDLQSVVRIIQELDARPEAGYSIMAACMPTDPPEKTVPGTLVPVLGEPAEVIGVMRFSGADTVVIASESGLDADHVRELSWSLEAGRQHLVVAPSLTDVGGPRIHTRPVAGLPLVHIETPRLNNRQILSKRIFDFFGSLALILATSPVLIVLALIVRFTSSGPIFYRQQRVGLNGKPFHMIKFRSMVVGADAKLEELLAEQGAGDTPLFKVENDPRVTPIGRILRKYSLDELPQLFNVLFGDMSLVGPRPQREGEVALYDEAAARRLVVKPGMSGLWQVSGRSTLSWEDAIRLDLYYVENWSLTGDIAILLKTVRAVVAPGETAH